MRVAGTLLQSKFSYGSSLVFLLNFVNFVLLGLRPLTDKTKQGNICFSSGSQFVKVGKGQWRNSARGGSSTWQWQFLVC